MTKARRAKDGWDGKGGSTFLRDHGLPRAVVGLAIGLALITAVAMPVFGSKVAFGETRVLAEFPWFLPVAQAFVIVSGLSIAFLSAGRYLAVGGRWVLWMGAVFLANAVLSSFYLLSWPGLVGSEGLIARSSNTASWLFGVTFSSLALLVPVLALPAPEQRRSAQGVRVTYLAAAAAAASIGLLSVSFEDALPLMATGGSFTTLNLVWVVTLSILMGAGAVLAYRRYQRDPEAVSGYLALFLVLMAFGLLYSIMGGKRYDAWWFAARGLYDLAYLVMLFGLLQEGYALFGRERERAEEREQLLRDVEYARRRFQAVVEHSPVGICVWRGRDLRYEMVNPAYQAFAPGKKLLDRTMAETWPETIDQHGPLIKRVMETGEPYHSQDDPVRMRSSPSGPLEDRYFSASYVPMPPDSRGRRAVLHMAVETTEQVRVRQRVEELAALAAGNLAQLEATFASIVEGVVVYGPGAEILRINRTASEFLGFSREVANLPQKERLRKYRLETPDGEQMSPEETPASRALRGETLQGFLMVARHADGRTYWLSTSTAPIRDEAGEIAGAVATLSDVTRQRELQRELERLLAAEQEARGLAERAVRARDDLISIAAHELKTPVTSLRGFSQLLTRQIEKDGRRLDGAKVLKAVQHIEEQSKRLTKLTEQLLDLSRLETGKLVLNREDAELGAVVANLVAGLQQSHRDRRVGVRRGNEVPVCADVLRLEQVLSNLIDNAVKFSPPESPIEVEVGQEPEGWARVSVRDYGIGIPEGKREQIFDRFFQAHTERHYSGMGIGLSVSRQIVEMHGGTISVEEPEGGGSRFVVRLPAGQCAGTGT
jgi:two-component system, OmpR family, phosphate regulon sensor histidine kinase PhoR